MLQHTGGSLSHGPWERPPQPERVTLCTSGNPAPKPRMGASPPGRLSAKAGDERGRCHITQPALLLPSQHPGPTRVRFSVPMGAPARPWGPPSPGGVKPIFSGYLKMSDNCISSPTSAFCRLQPPSPLQRPRSLQFSITYTGSTFSFCCFGPRILTQAPFAGSGSPGVQLHRHPGQPVTSHRRAPGCHPGTSAGAQQGALARSPNQDGSFASLSRDCPPPSSSRIEVLSESGLKSSPAPSLPIPCACSLKTDYFCPCPAPE